MKFNAHSEERSCGRRVPGELSDKYSDLEGLACARTAGHTGECIAVARDAGIADGVRWCCRVKLGEDHAAWCLICAEDTDQDTKGILGGK